MSGMVSDYPTSYGSTNRRSRSRSRSRSPVMYSPRSSSADSESSSSRSRERQQSYISSDDSRSPSPQRQNNSSTKQQPYNNSQSISTFSSSSPSSYPKHIPLPPIIKPSNSTSTSTSSRSGHSSSSSSRSHHSSSSSSSTLKALFGSSKSSSSSSKTSNSSSRSDGSRSDRHRDKGSSSRSDKYSSSSGSGSRSEKQSSSSSSSRSDKLFNSLIGGSSSSSSRNDRDRSDRDRNDRDKNRDYKPSVNINSNKSSLNNQPISSPQKITSLSSLNSNNYNSNSNTLKPLNIPSLISSSNGLPKSSSSSSSSNKQSSLSTSLYINNSNGNNSNNINSSNNSNNSPKPSPTLKSQNSKGGVSNLVFKKSISKRDRDQIMELLNEHDSDSDIDFTTTPTLSSHISKYSPAQSPLSFKPDSQLSNNNRGGSSNDNLYCNRELKNLDLNNTNDQNRLDNFLLSTENPTDIKSALKPLSSSSSTTTTTTTSSLPKPLDFDSDDEITEEAYRRMLVDHKKSKSKLDSDKFLKELELSDEDVFNEKNDRKQLKIMKRLMDKESGDRRRVKKKMTDPKYINSSSSRSTRDYSKEKYKASKYPALYGSNISSGSRKDRKLSDDDFIREFSDEDEEEFERLLRKKKKSIGLNSSSSGIRVDYQQQQQQQQQSQQQQPQQPNSQQILERLEFYKEIDPTFASNWYKIVKKEIPKSQKKYMDIHNNGINDCKKRSSMMKKEIKHRYQKAAQKLQTKDVQLRAKKLVKEMGAYWRKFDKDEREAKKRAEKEEANQRKRDEEVQEAKRQQRKLNFLISQTELYSHFMSKKLDTGGEGNESNQAEKEKKLKVGGEFESEEESSDDEGKTEEERLEEEKMKEEAAKKTQKAIELQLQKTKNFDQDIDRIKSQGGLETDTFGSHNLLEINNSSSIPPGFATSDTLKQPTILNANLKPYQLKGMTWIVNLYDQGINGILADEMGLGKTIQSIAVLAHLAEEKNIWGPFLIVTPKSTLHNWKNEFAKFVPHFKVIPYWGTQQQRTTIRKYWNPKKLYHRNSPFHVLITSYNVIVRDEKYFHRLRWQYMVLDEAHAIKSSASNRWKTLMSFNCRNRLLLTGTPIQNSMAELWALLHFIMPTFFDSHDEFAEWFSKDIENHAMSQGGLNEHQLNRLHMILKPFMLRRVKKDVENEMPSKTEIEVYCNLTHRQKRLYQSIRQKLSLTELLGGASFSAEVSKTLLNLVMQFRKVCNHPETFKRSECESPFLFQIQDFDPQDTTALTCPSHIKVIKCVNNNPIQIDYPKLLYREAWNQNSTIDDSIKLKSINRFNIFNINNQIQNTSISSINNQNNEGEEIQVINYSNDNCFSFLNFINLSPGELEKIYKEFSILDLYIYNQVLEKEVYPVYNYIYDEYKGADNISVSIKSMLLEPTFSSVFNENRINNGLSLIKDLCTTPEEKYQVNQNIIQSVYTLYPKALAPPIDVVVVDKSYYLERAANEQFNSNYTLPSTFSSFPSEISLLKLTMNGIQGINSGNNQVSTLVKKVPSIVSNNLTENVLSSFTETGGLMGELNHLFGSSSIWMPSFSKSLNDSGKLQVLDKLLKELKEGGHRVLIYSQFTKMINILEDFMIYRKYKYLRLDGSSKLEDRRDMVDDFQSDPSIFAFLLSTRACGIGINLTSADTVIFYDSDWNPTVDEQAMDRCHRLGQQRPVTVYRLISKGTIEEKILKRAKQKHHIQSIVITGGKFENQVEDQMGENEVMSLLLDDDEIEERNKKRKQPEPETQSVADKPFSPNDIPTTKTINKGRPPKEKDPKAATEPKVPKRKGPKPGFKRIKVDPSTANTDGNASTANTDNLNTTPTSLSSSTSNVPIVNNNNNSTITTTSPTTPKSKRGNKSTNEDGSPKVNKKPGRPVGTKVSKKSAALSPPTPTTPILSTPPLTNNSNNSSPK